MAYPGKLIGPLQSTLEHFKEPWLWKDSALHRNRRTVGDAKQVPARSMIMMEELSPTALPGTSSAVHGAQKYSQIGGDAAEQLIMSALESWNNGKQPHSFILSFAICFIPSRAVFFI